MRLFSILATVFAVTACKARTASDVKTSPLPLPGARLGDTCGDGAFGTPAVRCVDKLICMYPNNSTSPAGAPGPSSAASGTCQAVDEKGRVWLAEGIRAPITAAKDGHSYFVIYPTVDDTFRIWTTGDADAYMVLFREDGTSLRLERTDDDSGGDENAEMIWAMEANTTYVVRVRVKTPTTGQPPYIQFRKD